MYDRSAIPKLVMISVLSFLFVVCGTPIFAQQTQADSGGPAYQVTDFKSGISNNILTIEIVGDATPTYTVAEKFSPFRVVLDVAGAAFSEQLQTSAPNLPQNGIAEMSITDITDSQPFIKRFEFAVADTHDYKVDSVGNTIKMVISPAGKVGKKGTREITSMQVKSDSDSTSILFLSSSPISDYKVGTLAGNGNQPARMFIDIQDVAITQLVREKSIGTAVSRLRVAPRGTGARFVFDSSSAELFQYDIVEVPEGLNVIVKEQTTPTVSAETAQPAPDESSETITDETLEELIESSSDILSDEGVVQKSQTEQDLEDTFSFAGYNKQRISVDFYKIDIHNVFRLFRQITDLNIIVDEGVRGTLTLALTDVPWDFALDIILNLLDLEKEERFNTIVIYPKKKAFAWPERAEDNLSFETDVEVVEQEALIIQESANQPQEVLEAKELLRDAYAAEKSGDFEVAAELYEKAATLWPDNNKLYSRLSTIYLVNLGMNAKALRSAKAGLRQDPSNAKAALYAAIASANMQRIEEASEFFSQAISGDPPMKEALFSFAAFNENNGQDQSALKLLDKYDTYYGETKDTMLAKARLLDKVGETSKATDQYKAIISSGYQLRPDLKKYILGRIGASTN